MPTDRTAARTRTHRGTPPGGLPRTRGARPGIAVDRRRFLALAGLAGVAAMSLAACGTKAAGGRKAAAVADLSDTEHTLAVSNWPLYLDVGPDGTGHPTLEAFEKRTGITVSYNEDVSDGETFFAKIKPALSSGQNTGRDLIIVPDWLAGRLASLDWLEKVDHSLLPHAKNLIASLASPTWDPHRDVSLPWQAVVIGIAYNEKVVDKPVTSITELFTRPDLHGKVTAVTEMRDTMTLVMLDQGIDPTTFTAAQFDQALAALKKATDSGQIRQFTGNEYAQQLAKGDVAACIAWSGDIVQLQADNPRLKFVVPEAGAGIAADNMLMPAGSTHRKNAEAFMDYYYEPKVAAQLAAYVGYVCPVQGAQQEMEAIDPDLAKDPLIFPDDATNARLHAFRDMDEKETTTLTAAFQQVTGL